MFNTVLFNQDLYYSDIFCVFLDGTLLFFDVLDYQCSTALSFV